MRPRHLLVALAVCAALLALMRVSLRIGPAFQNLPAKTEGHFTEGGGWFKGEPFITDRPVRAWGSWNGSDAHTGALTLGPFPAPRQLRFAVGGYPPYPGNSLRIERVDTKEQLALQPPAVGERWRVIDQPLPAAWHGHPIQIVALDQATVLGGWLAITEPIRGGVGDGVAGLWQTLAAWALNGALLGVLWFAAIWLLAPRRLVAGAWLPLVALGAVAGLAYLAFWAYFADPRLGVAFSLLSLLAGLVAGWRAPALAADTGAEVAAVTRLLLVVSLLYLALLHLLPSSLDFYHLAANRFRSGLPTDNELPHEIASRLYAGEPLRRPEADWLSSDRPPLQSGWQLLTWPFLDRLGIAARPASGTSGFWLQLGWIAAAYGLLRTLRLGVRRAAAWVAVIALSGFFLQNSVFTWPKLSAGALACGAFACWVLAPPAEPRRRALLIGAALAALGWLSHGGVAFSFLALVPWILWRCGRGEFRAWLFAALVFGAIAAPWIAYQKFYDPPGDRLLKWHLGGQVAKDARGTWQTIRENYAALPWAQIAENKRLNLAQQVSGRWAALVEFDPAGGFDRRNQEFFVSGRALTWWFLGLAVFPLVWRRLASEAGGAAPRARLHGALLAWIALTVPLWCLLLFGGGQAVIHQGSYATMLAAFVLLSAWLDLAGRGWLPAIALLQSATLATTWAPSNPVVYGYLSPGALALALAAGLALIGFVVAGWREEAPATATAAPPAAEVGPGQAASASSWPGFFSISKFLVKEKSVRPGEGPTPLGVDSSGWGPALPWLAAGAALLPAIWCAHSLADLWWFGDDWDLLDQIQRLGFWRWTLLPFAENFVPLFKLLWGGLALHGGGSYAPMIAALWLTHALNAALFARLLRGAGCGLTATFLAAALFSLAAVNIESLAWSVQWSSLLAITFCLLAADVLLRHLQPGATTNWLTIATLALLSAASALAFARGVVTGMALATVCLLPGLAPSRPWPVRWRAAAACLLPALAVALVIFLVSPGNHRALGNHWQEIAQFGFCYWAATPLHRLLGSETWHWPFVFTLGALKLALLVAVFRRAAPALRPLLVFLIVFDLGNALLLGIGRYHTGLPAANSERYYYAALLCTLPFLGLGFARWLQDLPTPRWRWVFAVLLTITAAILAARDWPHATETFANGRGRNTRQLLLHAPNPPAENAVPGIPFLPTKRAKELISIYHLH